MSYSKFLAATCMLAFIPSMAAAETLFSASGTFDVPSCDCTALSGTLTLDDSTGLVDAASLDVTSLAVFNGISNTQNISGNMFELELTNSSGDIFDLDYTLTPFPDATSGTITDGSVETPDCNGSGTPICAELSGSLTAVTPLPAGLPLFAGGLSIVGLLARRVRKHAFLAAG